MPVGLDVGWMVKSVGDGDYLVPSKGEYKWNNFLEYFIVMAIGLF